MPFEDFLNAIQPLKKYYPKYSIFVVITGGEPVMRKDLAVCGNQLREDGFRWGIVTNGYAYDETTHKKLIAAGMGSITVSFDGLEQNHNALRNHPKSFERAVKALELIVSYPRLHYDVVTCVHQKNIDELFDLKEFLISKNVKHWRIFTIAPIGRAAEDTEMILTREQTHRFDIMRNRDWCKTGICRNCKDFKYCNGGAMHLWNKNQDGIMTCIASKLKKNI
jgi:radical SAM protein with 4Fe4S-binding SPASM domain